MAVLAMTAVTAVMAVMAAMGSSNPPLGRFGACALRPVGPGSRPPWPG